MTIHQLRLLPLVFLTSLLPAVTQAQSFILGDSVIREQGYGLHTLPDSSLLLALNEEGSQQQFVVWHLDPQGQVLDTLYRSADQQFVRGMRPDEQDLLLSGMRIQPNPYRNQATLTRLDQQGHLLWSWQDPDTTFNSEFKWARAAADGSIVACGSRASRLATGLDALVAKFDREGNLQWITQQVDSVNELAQDAIALPDGSWIVAGDWQMPDLSYRSFAMRLSTDDSLLWRVVFDDGLNSGSQQILRRANGHFLIIGESYPPGSLAFDVLLIELDAQGNLIDRRYYGGPEVETGICGFEDSTDHSLTICGYGYDAVAGNTGLVAFHIDSSGQEIGRRYYGGPQIDNGNAVIPAPQGGFWATGSSKSGLDDQVLLVRDQWPTATTSAPAPALPAGGLYPQPAQVGGQLHLQRPLGRPCELRWYRLDGSLAARQPLSVGQMTCSVPAALVPGHYQLVIRTQDSIFSQRLLLIP